MKNLMNQEHKKSRKCLLLLSLSVANGVMGLLRMQLQ